MNLFFVIKHFNLEKSFFVYLTKRLDDEFLKEMISKFLDLLTNKGKLPLGKKLLL